MKLTKKQARTRRHMRGRSKISGNGERPRIAVFRSNRHVSAQAIDDIRGVTIASVSSVTKDAKDKNQCNCSTAVELGKSLGEKLKAKGVERVVFDRGGNIYHGVIKAFAEGLRASDEANSFYF